MRSCPWHRSVYTVQLRELNGHTVFSWRLRVVQLQKGHNSITAITVWLQEPRGKKLIRTTVFYSARNLRAEKIMLSIQSTLYSYAVEKHAVIHKKGRPQIFSSCSAVDRIVNTLQDLQPLSTCRYARPIRTHKVCERVPVR